jgi:hypothetical protein
MPPVTASVGDAFQVKVVGRVEGQETNNILNFIAATSIDNVETRLILALAECFITNLLPVLTSKWTFEHIMWKQTKPVLGVEMITIPPGAGAGGGSANALPSLNSACISIRTAQGGRSKRGRMYIPGIPEDATTDSQFNTEGPFWAALIAFAACVVTKFVVGDPPAANSFQMEVYSRKLGGASFPYTTPGFTPVVSLTPDVIVATTRSRKLGRGA